MIGIYDRIKKDINIIDKTLYLIYKLQQVIGKYR